MNIVLDFDRTLFDTKLFAEWMFTELAQRSGRTTEVIRREAESIYYIYSGPLYYYDLFAQTQALFGEQADVVLSDMRQKAIATKNFLFKDVRRSLSALHSCGDVSILTYGKEDYQLFKISLCAELLGVPAITVLGPKGPQLDAHFNRTVRCVFVDDKDIDGQLPDWVEFYRIVREGDAVTTTGQAIASFDELVEIIKTKGAETANEKTTN